MNPRNRNWKNSITHLSLKMKKWDFSRIFKHDNSMKFELEELWTSICYNLFDPIKSPTYFWLWVICQQRSFRGVAIYNEWFCGDACNCHARSFLLSKFSSSWMTSSIHYMQTEISKRISISRVYMRFIKYTNLHQKCKRDLNQIFPSN